MRKSFLLAGAALMAMSMAACGGNNTNGNVNGDDSATVEASNEAVAAEAVVETAADVAFFDLKGNVKSCTYMRGENKDVITFGADGSFVGRSSEYAKVIKTNRDDQGRIVSLEFEDVLGRTYTEVYEYDKDGRIEKASCEAMPDGLSFEHNYKYDAKGRIESLTGWNDGPGNLEITYEYVSEDANGNWTERMVSTLVEGEDEPNEEAESRSIEYFK